MYQISIPMSSQLQDRMERYVGLEATLVIQITQIERLIVAHNVCMQMITKLPYNLPNPGTQHQGRVFGFITRIWMNISYAQ